MDTAEICAAGIAVTLLLALLRLWNPSFDLPMKLAAAILFLTVLLGLASPLFGYVRGLMEATALKPYAALLFRALGISLLCEIAGGICRECRENAVGGFVEMAGRLEILLLCLPLMEEILESVKGLLRL